MYYYSTQFFSAQISTRTVFPYAFLTVQMEGIQQQSHPTTSTVTSVTPHSTLMKAIRKSTTALVFTFALILTFFVAGNTAMAGEETAAKSSSDEYKMSTRTRTEAVAKVIRFVTAAKGSGIGNWEHVKSTPSGSEFESFTQTLYMEGKHVTVVYLPDQKDAVPASVAFYVNERGNQWSVRINLSGNLCAGMGDGAERTMILDDKEKPLLGNSNLEYWELKGDPVIDQVIAHYEDKIKKIAKSKGHSPQ